MPTIAYIGVGSNMGDKKANCRQALAQLELAGRIIGRSSLYCTEPVGYSDQEEFINAVAAVETDLLPEQLLALCHSIENSMGRTRATKWGPRTIDLDILLYGDQIVNHPDLIIPHPLMETRGFVLAPLAEIAPDMVHPGLNKTATQLLKELSRSHTVVQCEPGSPLQ